MKNRKKLALLAFVASMAVMSWVYPHEEVKAYPPGFRSQSKPCEIGGVVVSHGADCIPCGMYCIENPCPPPPNKE